MTNIVPSLPVLSTFDPAWKERYDEISQKMDNGNSSDEILDQLHAAHFAQFRTAHDYYIWSRTRLEKTAAREHKILATPELPKDATVDQIREWATRAYQALEEQDFRKLPAGIPEGINGFQNNIPSDGKRTTFYISLNGTGFFCPEARCTLEQTSQGALVCFHHIPDSVKTSPTTAVEELATAVKMHLLPSLDPGNISFYIHIPSIVGGTLLGECFQRVDMDWTDQGYTKPKWTHYKKIPPVIRLAETSPYEDMPLQQRDSVSIPHIPSDDIRTNSSIGWKGLLRKLTGG